MVSNEGSGFASRIGAGSILVHPDDEERAAVVKALLKRLVEAGDIASGQMAAASRALKEREAVGTTAIGGGVAIPHARVSFVEKGALSFALLRNGTGFHALDGAPVRFVFLLLTPKEDDAEHTGLLKSITAFANAPKHRNALSHCAAAEDVLGVFRDYA